MYVYINICIYLRAKLCSLKRIYVFGTPSLQKSGRLEIRLIICVCECSRKYENIHVCSCELRMCMRPFPCIVYLNVVWKKKKKTLNVIFSLHQWTKWTECMDAAIDMCLMSAVDRSQHNCHVNVSVTAWRTSFIIPWQVYTTRDLRLCAQIL